MKLDADLQPNLTDGLIHEVGNFFGYKASHWQELEGGIENTVVSVVLADGSEKVQKHYNRDRALSRIMLELSVVFAADDEAIPVPEIDENSITGGHVFIYQKDGVDWQVVSMERIDGTHPKSYEGDWSDELAQLQARLHKVLEVRSFDGDELDLLADYSYYPIQSSTDTDLQVLESSVLPHLGAIAADWKVLPRGVSHQDITLNNVVVRDEKVAAIIDFEDVASAPYIFCFAGTLWDVWISTGDKAVGKYLDSYREERNLTPMELERLQSMMIVRGWIDLNGKLLATGVTSEQSRIAKESLAGLLQDGLDLVGLVEQ